MSNLSQQDKKALKARAHHLNPVIIIGDKGLTDNIVMETDRALLAHELIKVRVNAIDRQTRIAIAEKLAQACDAALVQFIGHIAVLYRKKPE